MASEKPILAFFLRKSAEAVFLSFEDFRRKLPQKTSAEMISKNDDSDDAGIKKKLFL